MTFIRRNAIALLALFVALGGSSYAAIKLPARSVGERELKTGAVSSRVLADGIEHSLAAGRAGVGAPGPQGPKGDQGPQGPAGPAGTNATASTLKLGLVRQGDNTQALCNQGEIATGGGYVSSVAPTTSAQLMSGGPGGPVLSEENAPKPIGWTISGGSPNATVYVICAKP